MISSVFIQLMRQQVDHIIQLIVQWAIEQQAISAAALVGSWARGTAHAKSDVDLMFLSKQPLLFRKNTDWVNEIKWGKHWVRSWKDKDYGAVWSRHVQLDSQPLNCVEIEFSFGHKTWASIDPIDPGTKEVVSDGCQILYDPEGSLSELVRSVSE